MSSLILSGLVVIAGIVVILLLIWKNKKDEKMLNPDASDAVEETMMDKDQRKERS